MDADIERESRVVVLEFAGSATVVRLMPEEGAAFINGELSIERLEVVVETLKEFISKRSAGGT